MILLTEYKSQTDTKINKIIIIIVTPPNDIPNRILLLKYNFKRSEYYNYSGLYYCEF